MMPRHLKAACTSVGKALYFWNQRFIVADVVEPTNSVLHIMSHVLHMPHYLVTRLSKLNLGTEQLKTLGKLCQERLKRKPVQYIIGEWGFRGLTLKMRPPVFIPRPETEELVSLAIESFSGREDRIKILDLGCGSGAIALSLAHEFPKVECVAVDKNPLACELTSGNAILLGVRDRVDVLEGTLCDGSIAGCNVGGPFDLIVSNPPYLTQDEMNDLQSEISGYEDEGALNGGWDGLDVVRDVVMYSSRALISGGHLLMEVGPLHPQLLLNFVTESVSNMKVVGIYPDFTGTSRFIKLERIVH